MRILQVIPVFSAPFGGPVMVVRSISKELAKRHEVTVYTTSASDQKSDFENLPVEVNADGYRVAYFPRIFRFSGFNVSPAMERALGRTLSEYDVIHLHSWRHFQDVIVNHYAKKYKVPYVLQTHGSLPRIVAWQRLKWVYDVLFGYRLLRDASKVVALSRVEVEQYRHMGVPEEKIAIIPNGIDLSEYAVLPSKGAFKRKFGISEDKKVILYLGRVHKSKGTDFLVKAYAYLVNDAKNNDAVLVVAGPDDGYLGELRQLANNLKITDKVLFTEMLSEKEKTCAYVDSSIVVNVEPRNVFGLVPLEAAACGTPVIVSKGNAINDIIHKGKFGFSVKYGDDDELAETMGEMLTNDGLLREMGQRGRKYIFEKCDWIDVVAKLEKVYREVAQ